MNTTTMRIIFNSGRPTGTAARKPSPNQTIYIPSDRPVVQCDLEEEIPRNREQYRKINTFLSNQPASAAQTLHDQLMWAYRCFRVTQLKRAAPSASGAGDPIGEQLFQNRLYLFNVIVALEWRPSRRSIQQLEIAFRRAANFLYDITDGYMTFGQVLFGGLELMHCADIQIMASNRFNPRSWVSGLHVEEKYMPIRLGRGVWHKNNRVCIPWDEPEGYRTLIHEWAHYALELRDEYLESCPVMVPSYGSQPAIPAQRLVSGNTTLIIPKISLATESIMGTLEGTSELVPRHGGTSAARKSSQWDTIHKRFTKLGSQHTPLEGPSELPLPLPRFYHVGNRAGSDSAAGDEVVVGTFPKGIQFAHCWVYLLQGTLDAPQGVIAQGTLDARTSDDGFLILGAHFGDTVVLIGFDNKGRSVVLLGVLVTGAESSLMIKEWRIATPTFPMIDVLPGDLDPSTNSQVAQISVRISGVGAQPPDQVWVFPLGQHDSADSHAIDWSDMPGGLSAPKNVPSLDGHILVRWPDDTLVISTYSQGGGPQTGTPTGPPPISAGSSDGNVMLFFENKDQTLDYSDVRVVTTLIHGVPNQGPSNAQARGYTFSLASNQPLPVNLNPTLVMHYDKDALGDEGDMLIHQHTYDDSESPASGAPQWSVVPTYLPPGSSFAATPLNADTADRLTDVNHSAKQRRVERYRLYWRPRRDDSGTTGATNDENRL